MMRNGFEATTSISFNRAHAPRADAIGNSARRNFIAKNRRPPAGRAIPTAMTGPAVASSFGAPPATQIATIVPVVANSLAKRFAPRPAVVPWLLASVCYPP
jgi:hypothetical protein